MTTVSVPVAAFGGVSMAYRAVGGARGDEPRVGAAPHLGVPIDIAVMTNVTHEHLITSLATFERYRVEAAHEKRTKTRCA